MRKVRRLSSIIGVFGTGVMHIRGLEPRLAALGAGGECDGDDIGLSGIGPAAPGALAVEGGLQPKSPAKAPG